MDTAPDRTGPDRTGPDQTIIFNKSFQSLTLYSVLKCPLFCLVHLHCAAMLLTSHPCNCKKFTPKDWNVREQVVFCIFSFFEEHSESSLNFGIHISHSTVHNSTPCVGNPALCIQSLVYTKSCVSHTGLENHGCI